MTISLTAASRSGLGRLTGDVVRSTPGDNYTAGLASFLRNELSISAGAFKAGHFSEQFARSQALGLTLPKDDRPDVSTKRSERPGALNPFAASIVPVTRFPEGGDEPGRVAEFRARYDAAVAGANARTRPGEKKFLTVGEIEKLVLTKARAAEERSEGFAARVTH